MFTHILIPTDGTLLSNKAVLHGIAFAKTFGARVTVMHVLEPLMAGHRPLAVEGLAAEYQHLLELRARDAFAPALKAGREAGVAVSTVQASGEHPYEAIIRTATDNGCDLVFMASHGRSGIEGLLVGSETSKVLTHCKLPVIVHR